MKKHRTMIKDVMESVEPQPRWMCQTCGSVHHYEAKRCGRCDSQYITPMDDSCFGGIDEGDIGWKARRLARIADMYQQPVRVAAENVKLIAIAGLEDVNLTEADIAEASRLDRELADRVRARINRIHAMTAPPEPPKPIISVAASGIATVAKSGGKQIKIFGHSTTAIIRWMGSREWSYEDALNVLNHFGINLAKVTITSQLHIGREGITARGEPAKLTADQIKELLNLAANSQTKATPPSATQTMPENHKPKPASSKKMKGQTILGHSATAVIRWMGTRDWSIEDVNRVLKAYDIELSPITIKVNLMSGAGTAIFRGDPAKLSPTEIEKLSDV